MRVEIDIPKRVYDNIIQYCNNEGININDYIVTYLIHQINRDIYGDINNPKEEQQTIPFNHYIITSIDNNKKTDIKKTTRKIKSK